MCQVYLGKLLFKYQCRRISTNGFCHFMLNGLYGDVCVTHGFITCLHTSSVVYQSHTLNAFLFSVSTIIIYLKNIINGTVKHDG